MKDNEEKRKRQLIFLWNYVEWGGAQIYFLSIIKGAVKNWDVLIMLPIGSSENLLAFLDEVPVRYKFLESRMDIGPAPTLFKKVRRQFRRIRSEVEIFRKLSNYDLKDTVVHLDIAPWQSWILLYLLARRGNVFVTLHNALQTSAPAWRKAVWKRRLNFLIRRRGFNLFAANQDSINSVNSFLDNDFRDRTILTRAAVDHEQINLVLRPANGRDRLRAKHGLPADKFIVLCVGQFIERKGRHIFLDAARDLSRTEQDILFVWVGPQRPDRAAQEMIESSAAGNAFRFVLSEDIGSDRIDILQFITVADIFALPSLWEGLPIAILEAMALGRPTIATRINAIPEAVIDRETGILIEPGSSRELADAVRLLRDDPELRNRIAETGRRHVLENFDERITAAVALRCYADCFSA